ncbi:MAG: hypothetical protein AB8H86_17105 [Polyangiales bacterium]
MSTLGSLIVTSPTFIERVCGAWPRGRDKPRDGHEEVWQIGYLPDNPVTGPSAHDVARELESALPLSADVKVHHVWSQRIAHVGYPRDEHGQVKYDTPYPLFILDDEIAHQMLSWSDAWLPYADAALRRAAGLQAYCFVDDY